MTDLNYDVYEVGPGVQIGAWRPPGATLPTQVHLIMKMSDRDVVVRFKGTETLDYMIIELIKARTLVFGEKDNLKEINDNG